MALQGRVFTGRRGVSLLAIVIVLLPLGVGALAHTITMGMTTAGDDLRIVESLGVKIAYSPELARYVGTCHRGSSQTGYMMSDVGGFIKIEWFTGSGEVKIAVWNETVGTFKVDELRTNAKLLNLTVDGLPLKIAVAICNIPILHQDKVPDEIRRDALRLLENHSFIRWLRDEGFSYTVMRVMPLESLFEICDNMAINGVLVDFTVENFDISYRLYFDKRYILAANLSIPEEFKLSEYEKDNYCIYRTFMYEGGSITYHDTGPSRNITRPEPLWSRLNVTDAIREEVSRIMRENRVLARLLESAGCEIKKISAWEFAGKEIINEQKKIATAILLCEKIKGYGIKVGIDLDAGRIKEVYLCTESIIATMLSVY